MSTKKPAWIFSILLPLIAIALILTADALEGPKTAYVGVLAVVPMLAAVFGGTISTAVISGITLASAAFFGMLASDGNVPAQNVRLVIIALVGVLAIWAARQREIQEKERAEIRIEEVRADLLEHHSTTDALTGLLNRRGLEEHLSQGRSPLFFVLVDCDGLRTINQSFGHSAGDEFLNTVGRRLASSFPEAVVARWGGDEFVVLIYQESEDVENHIERTLQEITQRDVHTQSGMAPCELSAGITPWVARRTIQEILMSADQALSEAKKRPDGKLARLLSM
ncbi:GGDEF domain-containing protein [Aurantimicrobium minutum]|uniref:GGDEF domain-containing protein n=1 Tax=Aurantimicrobium minutum TaxID=708131 RepID=UPI002473CFE2|nr:GGDEF domain-containing protein [Aurantimicrobium minutum]